jgi:hypothetical protein
MMSDIDIYTFLLISIVYRSEFAFFSLGFNACGKRSFKAVIFGLPIGRVKMTQRKSEI